MRLQMSSSSGAMNRQTTSFTRNADRIPLVKMTPGSSCCGFRCSITSRVTRSKKPARCRLATISIIENRSTMVAKSMLAMADCGVRTPSTNIATAPMTAMAVRSISVYGSRPTAKTR